MQFNWKTRRRKSKHYLIFIYKVRQVPKRWMNDRFGHTPYTRECVLHDDAHQTLKVLRIGAHIDRYCTAKRSTEQYDLLQINVVPSEQIVDGRPGVREEATFVWLTRRQTVAPVLDQQNVALQSVVHSGRIVQPMADITGIPMKIDYGRHALTFFARMPNPKHVQRGIFGRANVERFVGQSVHGRNGNEYPGLGRLHRMIEKVILRMVENA